MNFSDCLAWHATGCSWKAALQKMTWVKKFTLSHPWALALKKVSSIFQAALGNVSPAQRYRHRGVRPEKGTKMLKNWSLVIWGGLRDSSDKGSNNLTKTYKHFKEPPSGIKKRESNSTQWYSVAVTGIFYKAQHFRKVVPLEFLIIKVVHYNY